MPKQDNQTEVTVNNPTDVGNVLYKKSSKVPVIALTALATFAFIILLGSVFLHNRSNFMMSRNNNSNLVYGRTRGMQTMMFRNNLSQTENSNIISGVVTSVADSSFVVAGNGAQTTIKTNSSTTFNTSARKVAVNDTVIVNGVKSDTTITADAVRVINL